MRTCSRFLSINGLMVSDFETHRVLAPAALVLSMVLCGTIDP
ncbi:MAG TPA: hypothetical protein VKV37_16740 [Ktedonobacteraceae bacterium]|jgi:hypothetical protein|nr:hypothetical protein [Ktedonobacteraceae bacterium]